MKGRFSHGSWLLPALLATAPAGPAGAEGFAPFEGRWRGEGQLSLDGEPPQRLRCQLRLQSARAGGAVFSGRCATAQAAQSFVYLVQEQPDGRILARNTTDPPDALPREMPGTLDGEKLGFEAEGRALFEFRRVGEGMQFRIEAETDSGFAAGTATLGLAGD